MVCIVVMVLFVVVQVVLNVNLNCCIFVLYDSIGDWAWFGEVYVVQVVNLVLYGSVYVMYLVVSYVVGELGNYIGFVYIGFIYDELLFMVLFDDVFVIILLVLWMNNNIWQFSQCVVDFVGMYGWSLQYFDFSNVFIVMYKGVILQCNVLVVFLGLLQMLIIDLFKVQVIVIVISDMGVVMLWVMCLGNFIYIGEIFFSYIGMIDCYFVVVDLISQVVNLVMCIDCKWVLVCIEDVSVDISLQELCNIVDYLYSWWVFFSVVVILLYLDLNGVFNNGVLEN